jgi:hypothetical protein
MSETTMNTLSNLRNEGTIDRAVRVILGVALLSLMFVGPQTLWGAVGLIPLITGLVGFCPLYRLVGLSTCKDCAQG